MKYVISDSEWEPIIILGNQFHSELVKAIGMGRIGGAGHFKIVDGKVETYGESIGLNMKPREEDAELIRIHLGL